MSKTIQTKRCPRCKQIKLLTNFYKNENRTDKLTCWCKQCCLYHYETHKIGIQKQRKKFRKTLDGYLRKVWQSMCNRCNNPKHKSYHRYGGRNIQVKFVSFEDFFYYVIKELKADPRGLTIDRINNDGHYEKGNIRFVNRTVNARNRIIIRDKHGRFTFVN